MDSVTDLESAEPIESTESTETFDMKTPEDDEPEEPPAAAGGDQQAKAQTQAKDEDKDNGDEQPPKSLCRRIWNRWCVFYNNNDFLIMIVIAILLARAYPPLGADYLQPEITSTWIAVIFIFGTYYE
jgi:sodium/bile acid cotransporter 7